MKSSINEASAISGGWRGGGGVPRRPEAAEGKASTLQAQSPSARSSTQGKWGTPPPRQDPPA